MSTFSYTDVARVKRYMYILIYDILAIVVDTCSAYLCKYMYMLHTLYIYTSMECARLSIPLSPQIPEV